MPGLGVKPNFANGIAGTTKEVAPMGEKKRSLHRRIPAHQRRDPPEPAGLRGVPVYAIVPDSPCRRGPAPKHP